MQMIDSWGTGAREFAFRVLMTLLLAPLGIWAVVSGGVVLAVATALVAVLAAFEWARMTCQGDRRVFTVFLAVCALGGVGAVVGGFFGFGFSLAAGALSAAVCGLLAVLLGVGPRAAVFGALYTSLPFGAFFWLRDGAQGGEVLALGLLGIVWATDIAAYFAGRGFGGPLLAPQDSPNKTWTGAIGALICACLTGAAVARVANLSIEGWVLAGAAISLIAQAGDLLESRIKRRYQVKDTSGLIPGHGGVLDRLDALMAASLALGVFVWLFPGQAQWLVQWQGR